MDASAPAGPTDLPERLRAARQAVADAHQAWHLELQLRGALIVAAADAGYQARDIAEWAGIDRKTANYWIGKTLGEQPC